MLVGIVAYPLVSYVAFLPPYLIFAMLLFTFCKLSPRDIHIHIAHIWLLIIQMVGCLVVYGAAYRFDPVVAQGAFICVLAPTAASAAVVTGMLGGSVPFHTSYLLLCNIAVAIASPLLFPLIGLHRDMTFWPSFFYICRQTVPVLICPLLLAWAIRYRLPRVQKTLLKYTNAPFYLWAVALVIVTGSTMKFLVEQENPDYTVEISLAAVSLIICIVQFASGKWLGRRYGDSISSGQGLGQKNTILAIWMAQAYLNPISSVAPAAYVLWQNIINSYQLWQRSKKVAVRE
ncbi:MAG: transporter [Tannerellaceae bacterium]|jgi:BASS family bile acid:Na+ symporter|nr:transporter [Tannerellaceae bacterium]